MARRRRLVGKCGAALALLAFSSVVWAGIASAGTVYPTGGGLGSCSMTLSYSGSANTSVTFSFSCTLNLAANVREIGVIAVNAGYEYHMELCDGASGCGSTNFPTGSNTISGTVTGMSGCSPLNSGTLSGKVGFLVARSQAIVDAGHAKDQSGCGGFAYIPAGVSVSGIYEMSASEDAGSEDVYDINAGLSGATTTLNVNGTVTGSIVSPCTLVSISGDTADTTAVQNGTTVHDYTVWAEGGVDGILVDDTTYDVTETIAGTPTRPTVNGTKYSTDASFVDASGEWDPSSTPLPTATATNSNDPMTNLAPINIPVEFVSGSTLNPGFYCWTGSTWVSWGQIGSLGDSGVPVIGQQPLPGPGPVGSNPSDYCSFDQWLTNVHMSLYDPFTWVSGGLVMLQGMAECLFVPDHTTLSNFEQTFGITSDAPTGSVGIASWMGVFAKDIAAFPSTELTTVQTVADGGGCSGVVPFDPSMTIAGHSLDFCTLADVTANPALSSSATEFAFLKALLTVMIYVGGAMELYALVRRMLA